MKKFKLFAGYAWKMLTMPVGTTFEWRNRPVNRFAYTWNTLKFIRTAFGSGWTP